MSKELSGQRQINDAPYHGARTVEELTQRNVETIVKLEDAAQKQRTRTDVVVDAIADFCGHLSFVWCHAALFVLWIGWNVLSPSKTRFDKYPFEFLTFAVSLEAIFLSTFILISQNREARLSERRSQLDLQINLLSEQETTKILSLLNKITQHLEIADASDPEVQVLEAATRPEKLLEQIESSHQLSQNSA